MARFEKAPADPRGGHARLYWEILDSNAWRSLTPTDQRAHIALLRQLRSTNNGDLSLPLTLAKTHGIKSPATLAKSLRALAAVGLIAVTRTGGCSKGGQRIPTLYRLTDQVAYENPKKFIQASKATNEWKRITSLAIGRAAIRETELAAARTANLKAEKKTLLQNLAPIDSKNEVVSQINASKIEVWAASTVQNLKRGECRSSPANPIPVTVGVR